MRLILYFILILFSSNSFVAFSSICYTYDDTTKLNRQERKIKKQKDTLAWISQDDKIILGSEISLLHVNLDFDNVFGNASDSIVHYFYGLDYWKFRTSHNPSGISYFINSRFGKINFFSHKIPGTNTDRKFESEFTNFGYGYQFKKLIVNGSYRRINGFIRDNLYLKSPDTLRNLVHQEIRLSTELITFKSSQFNKYGYSQLYIPVKSSFYVNFRIESLFMKMADKGGVIPFIAGAYLDSTNKIKFNLIESAYMQKVNLYVQSFFIHMGGILPIIKKTGSKPKSLFFRGDAYDGLDFFWFHVYPGRNGVEKSGLIFKGASNLFATASLIYTSSGLIMGVSASFKGNNIKIKDKLSANYFFTTLTGQIAYRIPFKKGYAKIKEKREKIFSK